MSFVAHQKKNVDRFSSELELRNCLQLSLVLYFSFVVPRKRTRAHSPPSSNFKIVCSCIFIVCSSSKTNEDPFTFEVELRNRL